MENGKRKIQDFRKCGDKLCGGWLGGQFYSTLSFLIGSCRSQTLHFMRTRGGEEARLHIINSKEKEYKLGQEKEISRDACSVNVGSFFGCEDAAQQVLMYVCLSVCLSPKLKFYLLTAFNVIVYSPRMLTVNKSKP